MTISLAGFHLGTMADAAMYFIWHDEAQLHSTRGALGQTGLKSPRHYLSCLLRTLGTSFQCHYMALWNCSHVSCDRMHCIIIVETASFPSKLAGVNTFRGIRCSERRRALRARRRRSGARTPLRSLGAALAPLHVMRDPPTGCLFQMVMGPGHAPLPTYTTRPSDHRNL